MNKEIKASPNETRSIQKSDLDIAIFMSLILKDINKNIRKKIKTNKNIDLIKIPTIIVIG